MNAHLLFENCKLFFEMVDGGGMAVVVEVGHQVSEKEAAGVTPSLGLRSKG